jgi:glucokinase
LNDLEAHAWGLDDCPPEHIVTLNAGSERRGNRALIAAGTGLGQALLFFDGKRHRPSASEGGHCAFAPVVADDDALLAHIRKTHKHVSWERVVSGLEGFRNMYDFLVTERGETPSPALLSASAAGYDLGAAVVETAAAGDAVAQKILRWFARLYGAEAGNLALKGMSIGGLYVGGGIAPRILPYLEAEFMGGFAAKGRFRELLSAMPVRVVTDPDVALIGAARFAVTHAKA